LPRISIDQHRTFCSGGQWYQFSFTSGFGFEPASRLEQVGDEHSERMQDRKHRLK